MTLLLAVTVAAGVGLVMMRMGLRQGVFEARLDSRRCASCGHLVKARFCPRCSRSSSSR
jgi:rRNA maturation endonuclease Nob1